MRWGFSVDLLRAQMGTINDTFNDRAQSLAAKSNIHTIAVVGRTPSVVSLAMQTLGFTGDFLTTEGITTGVKAEISHTRAIRHGKFG